MVKVSRKKIGVIFALLGVLGTAAFLAGGRGIADVVGSLIFLGVMLSLAVLFSSGVSRESNVSVARGHVFVYPRTIGNETTALSESTCKPVAVKREGDAVLVSSRWSQLRILFENEADKTFFIAEVSGLVNP